MNLLQRVLLETELHHNLRDVKSNISNNEWQ